MPGEEVFSALEKAVQPQGKWTTKWTIVYEDDEKPGLTYYWNVVFDKPMKIMIPVH